MAGTPIKITLYGPNDDIKQEYTRLNIPWGVLKKAIALTKSIDQSDIAEADMDTIAALVVEAFGNQFTVKDLDDGADIGEMLAVLQGVVQRASALVRENPTIAPPQSKKIRSK